MPDALTQVAEKVVAPLKASAIVLPMVLILITVMSQADTELIRPDTQISLEKINLPSGTLFTPLLGLKLSVFSFYAVAPLIVFVLHWMLLDMHPVDEEPWAKAVRNIGTVIAPVTLFALLWRFAPYAHARPPYLPGLSIGIGLSYLHAIFLISDTALILYRRLDAAEQGGAPWGSRAELLRRIGMALRAFMQATLLFLVVFVAATIVATLVRSDLGKQIVTAAGASGITDASAALIASVFVGIASWPALVALRRSGFRTTLFRSVNPDRTQTKGASMSVFAVVLTALVASVTLPDLGRPLNLVGARLAAAEPSDAIIAAMIPLGPERARKEAWLLFGRGLDYTRWQFAGASFDDATMPLIKLTEADLRGASLIRANMSNSHLQGARLAGAVLSEADLQGADLTCANVDDLSECLKPAQAQNLKLAQAQKGGPAGTAPARTNPEPASATNPPASAATAQASPGSDTCAAKHPGPTLNRANLVGAKLTRADLSGASMRSVDFTKVTEVAGAKFVGADLTEASFKDLNLDFSGVDFSSACLCGVNLSKVNLENAKLSGATLRNADLSGATLPPDLHGIDFSGANLKGTIFKGDPPESAGGESHGCRADRQIPGRCASSPPHAEHGYRPQTERCSRRAARTQAAALVQDDERRFQCGTPPDCLGRVSAGELFLAFTCASRRAANRVAGRRPGHPFRWWRCTHPGSADRALAGSRILVRAVAGAEQCSITSPLLA